MVKVTEEEILRLKAKLPPIQEALAKFNNEHIMEFVREALEKAPDEFWLAPFDQVIPGGLINHMLIATYFVEQGIRRYPEFTNEKFQPNPRWLDLARAACMLHDIKKCGDPWGDHTVKNHGHLGAEFLKGLETFQKLDPGDQRLILNGVRWHMGRWEEGFEQERVGNRFLFPSRCFTGFELLIQEADYYSTRTKVRVAGFDLINYECEA